MKSMSEKNNILDNDGFLGKGWNFPPTLTENGVKMVSYEEDIQQSLYVLLSTSPTAMTMVVHSVSMLLR